MFPLEALGESVFLPFPASRGCLHSSACGGIILTSAFVVTLCSSPLTLLPPSYKDLMMTWGHLDDPGSSLHLRVLNLIPPAETLWPGMVTYVQVPVIRARTSLGPAMGQP